MIPFEKALKLTLEHARVEQRTERVSLSDACGRIVAEDVAADRDCPPFPKAAMDGYACRRQDLRDGALLRITGEVSAGAGFQGRISAENCARILTGAPVPEGADCVIMQEQTERLGDRVRILRAQTADNICAQGEDFRKGEIVVRRGERLGPPQIAVLAACGAASPLVVRRPSVAVLSTGNELVEPDCSPSAVQIRNSNAFQLMAQLQQMRVPGAYLGIAQDSVAALAPAVEAAVESYDVTIITGGVSTGDYDLVPQVLRSMGFDTVFDSVAMQPGRPTHLAVHNSKVAWGLPGNPVSTFVVFELLVKPFLYRLMGHEFRPIVVAARLTEPVSRRSTSRQAAIPVRCSTAGEAVPVRFNGSADIRAMANADGVILIPAGMKGYEKGDIVNVRLLRAED